MRNILLGVLSLVVFFVGLKVGHNDAGTLGCSKGPSSGDRDQILGSLGGFFEDHGDIKAKPCPEETSHDSKTPIKSKRGWFPNRKPDKPPGICPTFETFGNVYLHEQKTKKNKGGEVDTVINHGFGDLHHPPSPSNSEIIVSARRKIESYEECSEIYMTRSGSRGSMPNKCMSVVYTRREQVSPWMHSHRYGEQAKMIDRYVDDYLERHNYAEETEELPLMLNGYKPSILQFRKLLGNPLKTDGTRRAVVVMVANEGVIDLVLNFLCSCRDKAANIDISSIVIFLGQPEYVSLINNMGARGIYNQYLSQIPKKAAGNYGDNTFGKLMWLKTTSVYIALAAGFDVIFQDADLVWLKDPVPHLQSVVKDVAFMDDGARTPRFTPYFVNSGFYYFKNNVRVKYLMERMLKSGAGEISVSHSHQSVLIRYLSEAHDVYGIDVNVLDQPAFPSGAMFHQNKSFINRIKKYIEEPFVFHMCWTANREDKVKYLKELGMWYLPDGENNPKRKTCEVPRMMNSWLETKAAKGGESILSYCCMAGEYFTHKPSSSSGGSNLRGGV